MPNPKLEPTVFVVDDDEAVRDALKMLLSATGLRVEAHPSAASFLKHYHAAQPGCLVLDIRMPGMSGLALQDELHKRRVSLPIVFLTGHADVPIAVRALKQGAFDFIEKPLDSQRLVIAVMNALRADAEQRARVPVAASEEGKVAGLDTLTEREHEVLGLVLEGKSTRDIAAALSISVKTVEFHRARIREKLGVASLAELFKLFLPR
ncbi:MAG TPA: response regulator [Noviherbaspirillum sp.]|nr:response regulator [Noviherbaspirillum sp.]